MNQSTPFWTVSYSPNISAPLMQSYTATAIGSSITFSPENGLVTSTGFVSIISTGNGGLGTLCSISVVIVFLPVCYLVNYYSAYQDHCHAYREHSQSVSH